jgi:hypothetical protein
LLGKILLLLKAYKPIILKEITRRIRKLDVNFVIKNKKTLYSLSLILMLAMTLMMAFAQTTSGQAGVPQPEKTVGYISVGPTLCGVGQTLTVNTWVFPVPTKYDYSPAFNGFYDLTVTFARPDGTKDTFMPTDGTGSYEPGQMQSLGALYFFYKPDMAGNWSVSWTMPAQNITSSAGTVQFLGCTSNTFYFTVQTDPVLAGLLNGYPWSPLPNPNVFWSYPISANNREWSQISGEWTGVTSTMPTVQSSSGMRWQRYGTGPNTPHIVWKQPLKAAGLIGGEYGSYSYFAGLNTVASLSSTTMNFGGPTILVSVALQGKVFKNVLNTQAYGQPYGQFRCFDLATGEVLYTANGSISAGIRLPGNTYAQSNRAGPGEVDVILPSSYGADYQSYLYGTATVAGVTYWNYYDPATGTLLRQFANASSSRLIDGTALAFGAGTITGVTGRYVYRWNMTSVVNSNWPTGIQWKVTLPTTLTGAYPSLFAVSSDASVVVIGTKNQYWGYSAETGAKLWNITLNYPITSNEQVPLANVDDFFVFDATAATFKFYSIKTGAFLFETPSFADSPWATTYTIYFAETNDLNNVYFAMPDGAIRAYSLTDGHLLWTSTPFASTEYANNAVPYCYSAVIMVDGKIYAYAGYSLSYQLNPVPRFALMTCVNATTGETIFALNGGVAPDCASNGILVGNSIYDSYLYGLGKGTTKTTVTAQQQVGGSVLIQGSVLDASPASSGKDLAAKYPNGVPAISDADMSVWMDYLHMQNATLLNTPPACNGVPVSLDALDSNGNFIHVGDTTSDGSGGFGYQWNPTTPGLYKVFATFGGSESYYNSYGQTFATVATATATSTPATTAPSNYATAADLTTNIAVVGIAIIIAIAIVGLVLYRKK